MAQVAYKCKHCGKERILQEGAHAPDCCGERMAPIPLEDCTHPFSAEGTRPGQSDEACDDGVR